MKILSQTLPKLALFLLVWSVAQVHACDTANHLSLPMITQIGTFVDDIADGLTFVNGDKAHVKFAQEKKAQLAKTLGEEFPTTAASASEALYTVLMNLRGTGCFRPEARLALITHLQEIIIAQLTAPARTEPVNTDWAVFLAADDSGSVTVDLEQVRIQPTGVEKQYKGI